MADPEKLPDEAKGTSVEDFTNDLDAMGIDYTVEVVDNG